MPASTHEANINALAASKLTVGCKKDPLSFCPNAAVFAGPDGHIPSSRLQLLTFKATSAGGAHSCAIRTDEMTGPPRGTPSDTADGLQLADVRFSDNGATVRTVGADAAAWRLRSPRNRNSIAVTVHDQYGNLYRVGDHEVQATDPVTTADFPGAVPEPVDGEEALRGGYLMSRSGRRSIGYTHNGDTSAGADSHSCSCGYPALQRLKTIRPPMTAETAAYVAPVNVGTEATEKPWDPARSGSPSTGRIVEAFLWTRPEIRSCWVTRRRISSSWTARTSMTYLMTTESERARASSMTRTRFAYSYGDDDKFVVEGEVVSMDQFEEILAQHGPLPLLIEDLGTLSWVGYDFNRPRDGATWSIDGLRMP